MSREGYSCKKTSFLWPKYIFRWEFLKQNMAGLSDLQSTFPEERLDGKTVSKLICISVFFET